MQAQKAVAAIICAAALSIILLAMAGGVINYSPVPYWDMWNGTLGFIQSFDQTPRQALFEQHNEHRIVLTNLLFLLEYKIFDGSNKFLIIMNYVCVALIAGIFWRCVQVINRDYPVPGHSMIAGLLLSAWLFLWTQQENLTWAFQSQFFLAELVPLMAFLALGRATLDKSLRSPWFWSSVGLGILSVGTMANGVATLPLLALGAIVLRQGWLRSVILVIVAAACITLYFQDYHNPVGHGSLIETLLHDPVGMMLYTFRYLGSPFFYIFGGTKPADIFAVVSGAILAFIAAGLSLRVLMGRRLHHVSEGLLLFMIYVGLSAFVTAGGRLILGMESAFASRYTTPALMVWAALFCIMSPLLLAPFKKAGSERLAWLSIVCAASLMLLKYQLVALTPVDQVLHQRNVAVLAAELGIKDPLYMNTVFPSADFVVSLGAKASETDLAIFGLQPYRDLRESIGQPVTDVPSSTCLGHLDHVENLVDSSTYVRIHGWQFDPETNKVDPYLKIVNDDGALVGFALSGQAREDVAEAVDRKALKAGFDGYVLYSALGDPLTVLGEKCQLQGGVIERPFMLQRGMTVDAGLVSVTNSQIVEATGWDGADYYRSELPGLQVRGTWVTSDADTGTIRLVLKPGDTFLYRSGPTQARQLLKIVGTDRQVPLQTASEWTLIELNRDIFETDSVEIEITDADDGWGGWSAIAVRAPESLQ